jgi:hypothetical protein
MAPQQTAFKCLDDEAFSVSSLPTTMTSGAIQLGSLQSAPSMFDAIAPVVKFKEKSKMAESQRGQRQTRQTNSREEMGRRTSHFHCEANRHWAGIMTGLPTAEARGSIGNSAGCLAASKHPRNGASLHRLRCFQPTNPSTSRESLSAGYGLEFGACRLCRASTLSRQTWRRDTIPLAVTKLQAQLLNKPLASKRHGDYSVGLNEALSAWK